MRRPAFQPEVQRVRLQRRRGLAGVDTATAVGDVVAAVLLQFVDGGQLDVIAHRGAGIQPQHVAGAGCCPLDQRAGVGDGLPVAGDLEERAVVFAAGQLPGVQHDRPRVGVGDRDPHHHVHIALHHWAGRGQPDVDAIDDGGVDGGGRQQAGGGEGEAKGVHVEVSQVSPLAVGWLERTGGILVPARIFQVGRPRKRTLQTYRRTRYHGLTDRARAPAVPSGCARRPRQTSRCAA